MKAYSSKRGKTARIVLKDGYWVDLKTNNRLSSHNYTEEEALLEITDLNNNGCKNCKDCVHCLNCINCINCFGCINCNTCINLNGELGKLWNV